MTRAGSGQTGAAVNLWLPSRDPKKAETARLLKNKPYVFGYRTLREQDKIPADHVLVDRLTLAITFWCQLCTREDPAFPPGQVEHVTR
jgi:hypothetical protein